MSKLIRGYKIGEPVKEAPVFEFADINRFLAEADSSNCYILVRKAICVVAINGGMRGYDWRYIYHSGVKEVPSGYRITYTPCKQGINPKPIT